MVQAPLKPLSLQLPQPLNLRVIPEQFAALAAVNRELHLERTATGELIVNPPTGGNTDHRNLSYLGKRCCRGLASASNGFGLELSIVRFVK